MNIAIYERIYNNSFWSDGQEKANEFLGHFNIIEVLDKNLIVGEKRGKIYLVYEVKILGINGGSKFEIKRIKR